MSKLSAEKKNENELKLNCSNYSIYSFHVFSSVNRLREYEWRFATALSKYLSSFGDIEVNGYYKNHLSDKPGADQEAV